MGGEKSNSEAVSELGAFNSELFSERLRLAIGSESINKFASKCGFSESLVRKYLSGSIPGFDKAAVMARAAGVSLEWLAGERSEVRPAEDSASENTLEDEFAMIPGYSVQISTGPGAFPSSHEQPSRKLAFRRKWLRYRGLNEKDLVLVFAKGDSMEPTISDNNTLMIDTSQRELSDGSIYVIRTDHHLIAKRVQQLWNKGILLLSDNKEYKEQLVEPSEADDLEVIGRVVWIGKDV